MSETEKKERKRNLVKAAIACGVALAIMILCASMSLFLFSEKFADCDNGYTVWRVNPGAFSGYIYEVRSGIIRAQRGLYWKHVKGFLDENNCKILKQEI